MASGSFNISRTAGSSYCSYRVVWSSTANVDTNSSAITVWVHVDKSASSSAATSGSATTSVTVGSTTQTETGLRFSVAPDSSCLLFAKDGYTVNHAADGRGSATISVTIGGNIIGASGSSTVTLDTIPRTSSVSSTNGNIGSAVTISIGRASSSFTHTLTYSFGNLSGTIAEKTSSTSVSWTLPDEFYAQIPSATSGWGTITCKTYSGDTEIGSSSCQFTAYTVEADCKPTLSPTVYDEGTASTALTGNNQKMIKGFNVINYAFGAAARKSASISSYSLVNGGKTYSNSSGKVEYTEDNNFVFSVTDSRGYTTSQTVALELIDFVFLTSTLDAKIELETETTSKATLNISGNYWGGNFGAVENSLVVDYRCATGDNQQAADGWIRVNDITINNDNHTYRATIEISGLDYKQKYRYQAWARDALGAITSPEVVLQTIPVFDWGANDFKFNVPISIESEPVADFVIETGASGDWNYEKWHSGKAVCWGKFTVSSSSDPAGVYSKECTLPFEFANDTYHTFITAYQSTGAGSYMYRYYSTSTKAFWIGCNSASKTAYVYVIGKWR